MGAVDLLAAAVALGVAVLAGLDPALAHLVAFLALLILVQLVLGLTLGRLIWAIARAISRGPLGALDRLLGVAPGLARGLITATLFLLPFALLPLWPSV